MAGKAQLIVELTSDEERLLNGFRKAQAADEELRAGLKKTGVEVDAMGKEMVDAMLKAGNATAATTDKILKQLRGIGPQGKKLFGELSQHGKQSVDDILKKLDAVDQKLAAQAREILAEWAKTDKADKFEKTRAQLESLGGDFKILGAEIKKATEIPEDRIGEAKRLVAELNRIDPNAAKAIARAMEQAKKHVEKSRLDQFVSQLAGGTKQARELAKVLGVDMKESSLAAEGGIEGIAQKIIALRPELKRSVNRWKRDMAEAAKFGEGKYEQALNALRAGDPVSKQVADKIKTHLVSSGKIVERTFKDMIKPLEQIDPRLAAEARKWHKHLQDHEKKSNSAFRQASSFAVTEIASIAAAYVGVQEAVQFVTQAMQEQQDVLKKSADEQRTLAAAQQEALKNLATVNQSDRTDLLQNLVPDTAIAAAFPDLVNLTKAIGDTRSAGASVDQIKQILPVAAKLTALTPEFVDETSTALADSIRATGNQNVKEVASQLLLAGSDARIVDPSKLFRNLPPVQVAAANSVSDALRAESALQATAAFTAVTRAGADSQGDASQTAQIQIQARLRSFFQDLGKDATEATAELAKLKKADPLTAVQRHTFNKLSQNEADKAKNDREIARLQSEIDSIESKLDAGDLDAETRRVLGIQKRDLGRELSRVRRVEFSDDDAAQLQGLRDRIGDKDRAYQEKIAELEGTIAAASIKGYRGGRPELFFDQLKVLQQNPVLREAFLKDKFGEQRFRSATEQFVTGGQAYDDAIAAYENLRRHRGSTALLDDKLRELRFGTPQLEQAYLQRQAETGQALQFSYDAIGAQQGAFREQLADTLKETRSSGLLKSLQQSFEEIGIRNGVLLSGSEGSEEVFSGIFRLAERSRDLRAGGITPAEAPRVRRVSNLLETAFATLQSSATLAESPDVISALSDRASRVAGAIRSDDYSFLQGDAASVVSANKDVFLRLASVLERIEALQTEQLGEARKTAENTKPNQRRPTDATRRAAGAADRRRAP
ncbi:hypothetical protein [Planctomycetes bacterium TBK1r]|uniref:Chromosome partition protein Smc n=1 Tax=Stieleria magnilauensis TaxID=2527963 RepID=A0ABX5XSM1_9BACT|nr:hypothetical protein TBK1r_39500 [Planctomycetes bacterium TBK1r]